MPVRVLPRCIIAIPAEAHKCIYHIPIFTKWRNAKPVKQGFFLPQEKMKEVFENEIDEIMKG